MLKIVSVPNDILSTPVKPVTVFDEKLRRLIKEMKETLDAQVDPQGVGLAAPQIGISQAIFIMKPNPDLASQAFVNPKILTAVQTLKRSNVKTKHKRMHLEGCLSIARIWSPIERAKKIYVEYQTSTGEQKKQWFTGFKATVIQHEVDHLNGILFTQRALKQKAQLYKENEEGKLKKFEI